MVLPSDFDDDGGRQLGIVWGKRVCFSERLGVYIPKRHLCTPCCPYTVNNRPLRGKTSSRQLVRRAMDHGCQSCSRILHLGLGFRDLGQKALLFRITLGITFLPTPAELNITSRQNKVKPEISTIIPDLEFDQV